MTDRNGGDQSGDGQRNWGVVLVAAVAVGLVLIVAAYGKDTGDVTGFRAWTPPESGAERAKTLWDWADLLIVPLVLAGGALWWDRRQQRTEHEASERRAESEQRAADQRAEAERELAKGQARENASQTYLERMDGLLLDHGLRTSGPDSEVRHVARAQTLTTLRQLDWNRKGELVRFLSEAMLVQSVDDAPPVVSLEGANLEEAILHGAKLEGAYLEGAYLEGAHLSGAHLEGARLSGAHLPGARLEEAHLERAILEGANLPGANLKRADLQGASLADAFLVWANLSGANLGRAYLRRADLEGVNLEGANLDHVHNLTQEQLDATASYKDAENLPDGLRADERPDKDDVTP